MNNLTIPGGLIIRAIAQTDNAGLKQFLGLNSEGGKISVQTRLKVEDLQAAYDLIYPENYGLVAYLPGIEIPVGAVYGWPHLATFGEDSARQLLMVHSLAVHPNYQRQGIAATLVQALINWCHSNYGSEVLVYAFIQDGNSASNGVFNKLGFIPTGQKLMGQPVKTSHKTRGMSGYVVREISDNDYEQVVNGLNQFYSGYDLYQPQTITTFKEWLALQKLDGKQVKLADYYLITAQNGEILGGAGLSRYGSVMFERKIVDGPPLLKFANKFLKIVPSNGVINTQVVKYSWYKAGQEQALKNLWSWLRGTYHGQADNLIFSLDFNSSLKPLIKASPFHPTMYQNLVILKKGLGRISEGRPVV